LLANLTSIILAHGLLTVVNADTIVVLKDGRIVQQGNHVDLVQQAGLYRMSCEMQLAGNDRPRRPPGQGS
jgi:subfamily B ATP-binding cassette protein MsbA